MSDTYVCRSCKLRIQYHREAAQPAPDVCSSCRPVEVSVFRELTPMAFADQALCAQTDPVLFDSQGKGSHDTETARRVCRVCPVIDECLHWALENNEGNTILGGLTPTERAALRRQAVAA